MDLVEHRWAASFAVAAAIAMVGAGCKRHSRSHPVRDELSQAPRRGAEGTKAMLTIAVSAEETKPLKVGDSVPAVELADMEGRSVDLSEMVAAKRTVIIFYRGGW